ncbi:MAG: glycosyltransferase family 39 protein, partial [Anaerolineae bacterium]|nr:glycosyltransferase family 39 protein [Anaerolineae bacterium]
MILRRHGRSLWLILLTTLVNIGLAVPATRYGAAFILLWLLPGLAYARLLAGRHRRPTAEEVAVGLGLGMGTVVLLTLLLHYIPGPLTLPTLLTAVNMLIFVLILATPRPLDLGFGIWDLGFGLVSCVISVAAFFRLPHLSYSEFQGDEAVVMMRAARAILGDDAQLFYHQKGPAEVLLPMATWTLSGTINEWQARLPFAFAGLLGVVALYLLGRRWFNERNGQIAALLLAINGYFVGFGRVVQYQSL